MTTSGQELSTHDELFEISGFLFCGGSAGIKAQDDVLDFGLIVAPKGAQCAGVFTQNQVVAAPVVLSRTRLSQSTQVKAVVVNSGNANACTGERGRRDALEMSRLTVEMLNAQGVVCQESEVQVCSTGVIGAPLPMDLIRDHIPKISGLLRVDHLPKFAESIMTTDTRPKYRVMEVDLSTYMTSTPRQKEAESEKVDDYVKVQIAGAVKGAGMIHPNMATMLAFICTDASINPSTLKSMWCRVCDQSFNAISIDGDTSTNDTALLLASGAALNGQPLNTRALKVFEESLTELAQQLALDILRDGEGVEHVIHLTILGARSTSDARTVAETVALSPLVKTALNGEDPNWGRMIAAVGRSGVEIDPQQLKLSIGQVVIYQDGQWQGERAELEAHQVMCRPEYPIEIDLSLGEHSTTIYSTDLSTEYVKINADYRS